MFCVTTSLRIEARWSATSAMCVLVGMAFSKRTGALGLDGCVPLEVEQAGESLDGAADACCTAGVGCEAESFDVVVAASSSLLSSARVPWLLRLRLRASAARRLFSSKSLVQTPLGPRKSAIPAAVLMPAPVCTTTCLAPRINVTSCSILRCSESSSSMISGAPHRPLQAPGFN